MPPIRFRTALAAAPLVALAAVALAGCSDDDGGSSLVAADACLQVTGSGAAIDPITQVDPTAPEIATAYVPGKKAVYARTVMAVAANPVATKVACDVLNRGGTRDRRGGGGADGAQPGRAAVLGHRRRGLHAALGRRHRRGHRLRRPRDGARRGDARTTCAGSPTPTARRRCPARAPAAARSARRACCGCWTLAHADHGRLPWKELFQPAIRLATDGFRISPRMAASIDASRASLARDPRPRPTS